MSVNALIIDDEKALQEIISEVLRHMRIDSVTVGSGEQALQVCADDNNRFSVIFLDMNMPGMDGDETYLKLKKILPGTPVIFMSGYDMLPEIEKLQPTAAYAFLKKPFTMSQLMETTRSILG